MQFAPTEERQQFRDMVSRFLAAESPTADVRRQMHSATGFDRDVWQRMARELGLPALLVPERYGGAGFGMVEVGIAMEEMGRALYCGPYFGSALLSVAALIHCAEEDARARLLPRLASGETLAALAGSYRESPVVREGGVLAGTVRPVVDGMAADVLLVVVRAPGGAELHEVDPHAGGVERRALEVIDPTRRLAELRLREVPARPLGGAGKGLIRALDLGVIGLAGEMAGGARRLLDDTLEYLKLRVQFGRAIASFQAIKHRCAELLLGVELAKSAAGHAAAAADENDAQLGYHASLAKAGAADAYLQAAAGAIQLHGGIGFTAEHDTHLWYRRAKASEVLLGNPSWHRERMISELERRGAAA